MKNKLLPILSAFILAVSLSGCTPNEPSSSINENSSDTSDTSSTSSTTSSTQSTSTSSSSDSGESTSTESSSSDNTSSTNSTESTESSESSTKQTESSSSTEENPSDISTEPIPDAEQSARVEGDRILFTTDNVFSQDSYYSVTVSGAKCENQSAAVSDDTTYINGVLYGDFRLDLYKTGVRIDSLKINVPRDDSFMILENAAIGKDYGFSIMSHKREFSVDNYPDIIRLEFFRQRGMAVPQYARYFAIFDNKIQELEIYENGVEVSPTGTFLTMRGDGLMTQNLTVEKGNSQYTVIKYEYRFNLEKRRLDRKKVRFTGWSD